MKKRFKEETKFFVRFEITQALYQNLPVSIMSLFLITSLIAWELRSTAGLKHIFEWYCATLIVMAARLVLFLWYKCTQDRAYFLKYHYYLFVLGSSFSAMLLGIVGSFLMPENIIHQGMVIILISGIVAGAMQSLSSSFLALMSYITLTTIPILFWLWMQIQEQQRFYEGIFVGMIIFCVFAYFVAHRRNLTVIKHLELEYNYKTLLIRVSEIKDQYKEKATHDILTGLYNRQFLNDYLDIELNKARRKGTHLAVILLDIDFFKLFNDRYGHLLGDSILLSLGNVLNSDIRKSDIAARYGGDEFMVVLSDTTLDVALHKAELLRKSIAKISVQKGDELVSGITASLGVAIYPEDGKTKEELINAADKALYTAKDKGGNRVCVARKKNHKNGIT